MFGSQGGREFDREALLAQRRRAQRHAQHEDEEDEGSQYHSSGGFIKRDLQFGLALLVVVGFLVGPRFLPHIEPSEGAKAEGPAGGAIVQRAEPEANVVPRLPTEPPLQPPIKKDGESPLTDIVPRGYASSEKEKSAPAPKADDNKPIAPILPMDRKIAENAPKLETKRDPVQNAARKTDVVTEFVPYEEAPGQSKRRDRKEPPRLDDETASPKSLKLPADSGKGDDAPARTKLIGLPKADGGNGVEIKSFDRSANATLTGRKSGAGPIHPFFQRYLDEREYPVRYGDTFEVIAYRLYGDETQAAAIRAANPDVDKLRSGMRLRLPEPGSSR